MRLATTVSHAGRAMKTRSRSLDGLPNFSMRWSWTAPVVPAQSAAFSNVLRLLSSSSVGSMVYRTFTPRHLS